MGHIEIWGQTIPNLLVLAGRAIKEVAEAIPLSGFMVNDHAVFGLTMRSGESLSVADTMVIGAVSLQNEDFQNNLSESVMVTNA